MINCNFCNSNSNLPKMDNSNNNEPIKIRVGKSFSLTFVIKKNNEPLSPEEYQYIKVYAGNQFDKVFEECSYTQEDSIIRINLLSNENKYIFNTIGAYSFQIRYNNPYTEERFIIDKKNVLTLVDNSIDESDLSNLNLDTANENIELYISTQSKGDKGDYTSNYLFDGFQNIYPSDKNELRGKIWYLLNRFETIKDLIIKLKKEEAKTKDSSTARTSLESLAHTGLLNSFYKMKDNKLYFYPSTIRGGNTYDVEFEYYVIDSNRSYTFNEFQYLDFDISETNEFIIAIFERYTNQYLILKIDFTNVKDVLLNSENNGKYINQILSNEYQFTDIDIDSNFEELLNRDFQFRYQLLRLTNEEIEAEQYKPIAIKQISIDNVQFVENFEQIKERIGIVEDLEY